MNFICTKEFLTIMGCDEYAIDLLEYLDIIVNKDINYIVQNCTFDYHFTSFICQSQYFTYQNLKLISDSDSNSFLISSDFNSKKPNLMITFGKPGEITHRGPEQNFYNEKGILIKNTVYDRVLTELQYDDDDNIIDVHMPDDSKHFIGLHPYDEHNKFHYVSGKLISETNIINGHIKMITFYKYNKNNMIETIDVVYKNRHELFNFIYDDNNKLVLYEVYEVGKNYKQLYTMDNIVDDIYLGTLHFVPVNSGTVTPEIAELNRKQLRKNPLSIKFSEEERRFLSFPLITGYKKHEYITINNVKFLWKNGKYCIAMVKDKIIFEDKN